MIKTAGFLASAMVNGMDLGSIAAARSQSFQEIEEKRGWKRELENQREKKKKGNGRRRRGLVSESGGGRKVNTKLDGDSQKEGRAHSESVREGL